MTNPYILQARELLAVEYEKRDLRITARDYRKGCFDNTAESTALARVLREHDEFRQEVSDTIANYCGGPKYVPIGKLADFIISKPVDPLVEALRDTYWEMDTHQAELFRKALAAADLEIRESAK